MTVHRRPGAYFERTDRAAAQGVTLRSDVACFVGITRQGPLDTPVAVESFRQFQSQFGGFTGAGYLAYSVKAFFENGGERCWIVRVASKRTDRGALPAGLDIGPPGAGWNLVASSAGVWGDELAVRLRRERRVETALDVAASGNGVLVPESVAGLDRYAHLEITQPGQSAQYMVAAVVDPVRRRVSLLDEARRFAYPFQRVILDPASPAILTRVSYALDIYRQGRLIAHVPGLSQVPENPDFGPVVLRQPNYMAAIREGQPAEVAPPVIITDQRGPDGRAPEPLTTGAETRQALTGGRDGLAVLTPDDFTGAGFSSRDDDAAAVSKLRGVRTLELVDEISIVAVPDIVIQPDPDPVYEPEPTPPGNPCLTCPPPAEPRRPINSGAAVSELPPVFTDDQVFQVQSRLISHCEAKGDRFAVLDPPFGASQDDAAGISAIMAWRSRFESAYAALYYPWVRTFEPRGTDVMRNVPPSGHVVGKYAFHDRRTGVHRAPANTRLRWIQDLLVPTSFGEQEILNDMSVNVLRSEAARGLRIMGARTLSSDRAARFVNIRRLILLMKRAVDLLSQWVVFEPNNDATRTRYTSVLQNFLEALWARGAFAGATVEESFFVKCDADNNTQADRDNGRLIAEIGIAPSYPLEFIVMRVGRQGNELSVAETRLVTGAM
ncbi:phage tail sheath family protein [Tateyamaria omphalii]|uniref:Tail sheath protein C-terminal domain-containing protein n=1 Tax=Tateyamaria omphalii TaxID=299262 RepID=A0A1P8MV71_9RHOB|nr:phage tail sheath C-terminal domain-containing protein [Tateyamaria omphalii]APX11986.1 hypothetical protein BWR18_10080 [Tateyamaria omphalii]